MTRLIAYAIEDRSVAEIRPAPLQRAWMDATLGRFAYLCVPLAIANQHGWEMLAPYAISAWWDGGGAKASVRVLCHDVPPGKRHIAYCAFGYGILSFELPYVFRTEPGIDLFVSGPINRFKDGIAPQTGVMETDWNFSGAPMNWQFTRVNHEVRFEKGEPFCHIFPIQRGSLEGIQPELRRLSEAPDVEREYNAWAVNRLADNAKKQSNPAAKVPWQRRYMRGVNYLSDDKVAPEDHRTRLRLQPFATRQVVDRSSGNRERP